MARNIATEAVINSVRLAEQAGTITTPASGYWGLYAKSDGLYSVDDAGTEAGPFAASGGDSTTTAAYASRPAAGNEGDLFFPSDGLSVQRDTGAAWVPWGPLWPLTEPPEVASFTWVNQGSATATKTAGAIHIKGVDTNAQVALLVKAAPTPPYTITAAIVGVFGNTANNEFGIAFRQSSDGKIHSVSAYSSTGFSLNNYKWTDPATFSAAYTGYTYIGYGHWPILFLRIEDDATNRIVSWSFDGLNFIQFHSVTRTDFLTADQVGIYFRKAATTNLFTVLSWKEA